MEELNEEVVEETTESVEEKTTEPQEEVKQEIDESKFESAGDDSVYKVDLSNESSQESEKAEEDVAQEQEDIVEESNTTEEQEVVEDDTNDVIEEVTEEDLVEEKAEEAVIQARQIDKDLPENIQKLVNFMEETGGDLNDYVNLNKDISTLDDSEVLDEYYRLTKSHLTPEERSFLLEDSFGIDEELDDERTQRKKKIALKEQVAEAKAHLDRQKSKYYEDIKAGSQLTPEQQKAIDFFNRHNKESEERNKLSEASKEKFIKKTESVFNEKFKGFDYQVGDKKFRFKVKDIDNVKTTQSDINNFINKFVGEDKSTIEDAKGYHKSLFTAMNADRIANHFYEQGKADAIKSQIAKDKNINTEPRKTHGETNVGGVKYKVLGESANDFSQQNRTFKIRKK